MPPYLSIVMPAYNEEHNLATNAVLLITRLDELNVDFELLIVNDCSADGTPQLAADMAARDPRVHVLHHQQNCGIGQSLHTGFQHARGEWTIYIPADLAMSLDELPKYLEAAKTADVVVGLRSDRRDSALSRKIVSFVNIWLIRVLFRMPIHQFQYICMYRTEFLRRVKLEYAHSAFIQAEVLIKARDLGYRLTEITVGYIPRTGGVARGAKLGLVLKSVRDILHFWVRWLRRKDKSLVFEFKEETR